MTADGRLGTDQMLAELCGPAGSPAMRELVPMLTATIDPLSAFVIAADINTTNGAHQGFAVMHMAARSLSDLIAGVHLVSHGYLVQMYSVVRPVLDALDLVELFVRDPAEATTWIETDKAHQMFTPAAVRRRLDAEAFDRVHSHFSESGTHPRMAGANLSGGMIDGEAVLNIGPLWPDHHANFFAVLFLCSTTMGLATKLAHVANLDRDQPDALERWRTAALESVEASTEVMRWCYVQLALPPEDVEVGLRLSADVIRKLREGPLPPTA
jgi:hypothetical protein